MPRHKKSEVGSAKKGGVSGRPGWAGFGNVLFCLYRVKSPFWGIFQDVFQVHQIEKGGWFWCGRRRVRDVTWSERCLISEAARLENPLPFPVENCRGQSRERERDFHRESLVGVCHVFLSVSTGNHLRTSRNGTHPEKPSNITISFAAL